jgi:enoyl-CoA hydratase/carnithine racemase
MAQLIVTKNGPIGNILISNIEKMNAMTMDMWSGIPKALNDFDANPEVRVIVIRGDGEKAFISDTVLLIAEWTFPL